MSSSDWFKTGSTNPTNKADPNYDPTLDPTSASYGSTSKQQAEFSKAGQGLLGALGQQKATADQQVKDNQKGRWFSTQDLDTIANIAPGLGTAVGAIGGGILGAFAGGPAGILAGVTAGGAIGGGIGTGVGGWAKSDADQQDLQDQSTKVNQAAKLQAVQSLLGQYF